MDAVMFGVIPIVYEYEGTTLESLMSRLDLSLQGRNAQYVVLFRQSFLVFGGFFPPKSYKIVYWENCFQVSVVLLVFSILLRIKQIDVHLYIYLRYAFFDLVLDHVNSTNLGRLSDMVKKLTRIPSPKLRTPIDILLLH